MDRDLPLSQVAQDPIQPIHMQAFIQRVLLVVYCPAGKNPSLQNTLLWEMSQQKLPCPFCFQQKELQEPGEAAKLLLCCVQWIQGVL